MNAVTRPDRLLWVVFIALGFMWGSSYLFIKVGVDNGLPPFTLIAMRLFFGFLVIATVVLLAREPLPRSRRQYGHLLVMANVNIVLPFFLPDERITLNRLAGLAIGFVGVLVLFLPDLAVLEGNSLLGWFALLGSAVAYAIGNVYAKRNVKGLRPMIPALFQVGFALAITIVLALVLEQPIGRVPVTPQALFAYLLPVFGIALGAFVGEEITVSRLVGTALIIGGVALVNSRYGARPLFAGRAERSSVRPAAERS